MSKMGQLHAELSEQAAELGFETVQDALNSGYTVDYDKGKLVKHSLGYSETVEYLAEEQEKAHKEWLKEQDDILDDLEHLKNIYKGVKPNEDIVERIINFIKEQCHD